MVDISKGLHRRSVRLNGYDYTQPGAYFVTVVTQSHKCLFGKILAAEMHLNNLGEIVKECWQQIPVHFASIEVDPFVVMPNHIHGIITIHEDERGDTLSNPYMATISNSCSRGTIYRAPTTTKDNHTHTTANQPLSINQFGKPVAGSIPTIIRTYKAAVSRSARQQLGLVNIWQRNYYEHIVRDEHELNNISIYIRINPATWADDPETFP